MCEFLEEYNIVKTVVDRLDMEIKDIKDELAKVKDNYENLEDDSKKQNCYDKYVELYAKLTSKKEERDHYYYDDLVPRQEVMFEYEANVNIAVKKEEDRVKNIRRR